MTLTGEQVEELRDAITAAFDEDALVQMVRFKLGKTLFDLVGRGPLNTVAFDLITLAEQEGWTRSLVTSVVLVRPNNERVVRFCQAHAPWAFNPPESDELIARVTSGLGALGTMAQTMAAPRVSAVIGAFRADLQSGLREFECLRRYKALHDCLHTLQFQYYGQIAEAVELVPAAGGPGTPRFRTDERKRLALDRFCPRLRREIENARDDASELSGRTLEEDWIDDYERAVTFLEASLAGPDDGPAQRAVVILKSLLGQAPRINSNMALCAGKLPLDRLTEAMRQIADHLTGAGAVAMIDQFLAGLRDLQALNPRLQGLVEEHYEWQWLDKEFNAAEDLPGHTLAEKFPRWDRIRQRLRRLCDLAPKRDWAVQLRQTADVIEVTADPVQFRRTFYKLRDLAADRFYDIDQEMRELSERLVNVAGPLNTLLQVFANGTH